MKLSITAVAAKAFTGEGSEAILNCTGGRKINEVLSERAALEFQESVYVAMFCFYLSFFCLFCYH